jgi:transcriptional regulator with XRE-family HTH domain
MSMRVAHRQSGTALQRRRLGRELRGLRREAGLSLVEVGKVLYRSPATISRIERGQVGVTPRDVREMLRHYGVEDQRPDLVRLAEESHRRDAFSQAYGDMPPVFRTYLELERSAVSIGSTRAKRFPGCCRRRATPRRSPGRSSPGRPPSRSSGSSRCD